MNDDLIIAARNHIASELLIFFTDLKSLMFFQTSKLQHFVVIGDYRIRKEEYSIIYSILEP